MRALRDAEVLTHGTQVNTSSMFCEVTLLSCDRTPAEDTDRHPVLSQQSTQMAVLGIPPVPAKGKEGSERLSNLSGVPQLPGEQGSGLSPALLWHPEPAAVHSSPGLIYVNTSPSWEQLEIKPPSAPPKAPKGARGSPWLVSQP